MGTDSASAQVRAWESMRTVSPFFFSHFRFVGGRAAKQLGRDVVSGGPPIVLQVECRTPKEVKDVKYVLLFVDTEQFSNDLQAMDPAERDRAYARVDQWFADHAGRIRSGSKLQSPETATTVRLEGEPVITDGPFVEGKEVVSSYVEIDAADLDEALRMVKTWPGCPVVEIRPLES
jgi:hypothetical protein